jgi:hypothetical protein
LATALVAIVVGLNPQVVARPNHFPSDEHAKASLDLALNLSLCRRAALRSTLFKPAKFLTDHPESLGVPAPDLLEEHAGALANYCASLNEPVTNNENSLMLMEAAAWLVWPRLSVQGVGQSLAWIRMAEVWLFGVACLAAGVSVLLSMVAMSGLTMLLTQMTTYQLMVYSFLPTTLAAWVSICSLMFPRLRAASLGWAAALSIIAGIAAGYGLNVRTSYVPIFVTLFLLLIAASVTFRARTASDPAPQLFAATTIIGFGCGLLAFNLAVMRPVEHPARGDTTNYTYHTVAHPLVMALGVPVNALSRAEGIRWDDMVAWDLAKRVQPDVAYLGPEYERALYRYYFGLWRTRPREMIATYWTKLLRTGHGVFLLASELAPDWRPVRRIYLVWADRTNGLELMLVAVGLVAGALWALWQTISPIWLIAASLSIIFLLLLLESAVIYSEVVLGYHSFLVFIIFVLPAVALQMVGDYVARIAGWPADTTR